MVSIATGLVAKKLFETFISEPVKVSASFEKQMSKVRSLADATENEIQDLSNKAKELGNATKYTSTQVGEGMEYMAAAGWKTKAMLSGIDGILNLASTEEMELADASEILTGSLTAFALTAQDSNHFVDVMAVTSSATTTSVADLGESFKNSASLCGALKYSVEDASLALGLMANNNIKGGEAGTALNAILTRLVAPPKEAADALNDLRVSATNSNGSIKPLSETISNLRAKFAGMSEAQKTQYASNIAGQDALKGFLAIVNASQSDFDNLTNSINNAEGAAAKMAAIKQDNLIGDADVLQSAWEGIQQSIGEKIMPQLREGVQKLTQKFDELANNGSIDRIVGALGRISTVAFDNLSQLLDGLPEKANTLAGALEWLAKNLKTIVEVLTIAISAWAGFKVAMTVAAIVAAPIPAIIAAITAAVIYLYIKFEWFRDGVKIGFSLIEIGLLLFAKLWITKFNIMAFVLEKLLGWIPLIGNAMKDVKKITDGLLDGVDQKIDSIANRIQDISKNSDSLENPTAPQADDNPKEPEVPKQPEMPKPMPLPKASDFTPYTTGVEDKKTAFEKSKDTVDDSFKTKEDLIDSQIDLAEDQNDEKSKKSYQQVMIDTLNEKLLKYSGLEKLAANQDEKNILETAKNKLLSQIAKITNDIKENVSKLTGSFNTPSELSSLTEYEYTVRNSDNTKQTYNFYLTVKDLSKDSGKQLKDNTTEFVQGYTNKDSIVKSGWYDLSRN
jgi:TP901 family phage tail tape measure protein